MRAYEIQNSFGLDSLAQVERADPRPGPGQVLLHMRAFSLNYRDLLVVKGQYNPKLRLPFTPLSDGVGVVAEVGSGVTQVKVGDRVAGAFMQGWLSGDLTDASGKTALGGALSGVLAEKVILDATGVVPVPAHLTDEEASTLPCAAVTAWNALVVEGQIKAGDVVLVQGTGGVSLFALQFAKAHGARVLVTSGSDDKLARALQLGASAGINYKTNPDWGKKARELAGEPGVDHIVEVGGAGTLAESLRAVRTGGHISLIGILSGGGGQLSLLPVLMRGLRIQGIFVGSRAMFEAMNRAISLHALRPVVDRVFGFSEAKEALQYMESAAHFGKIVIRV